VQGTRRSYALKYTAQGLLSTATTRKTKVATFSYNAAGHLIAEKISGGYSSSARRNARGQLLEWTDSRGRHFTFQRDSRGAVVKITNTTGDWAKAERDTSGRISKLTNSSGQSRTFSYNAAGRLTNWTDALGRAFSVAYDPTTGKAAAMTQVNGSLRIVRGAHGEALLQATGASTAASKYGQAFSDGWNDPLYGEGLLGAFSGFSRYSSLEAARRTRRTTAVGSAASTGAASTSTTSSATVSTTLTTLLAAASDQGETADGDDESDTADDDDDDDDGDDDEVAATNPDCSPCEAAYQTTCTNSRVDALDSAQGQEALTLLGCAAISETGIPAAICAASAVLLYQQQVSTAETNYSNCLILIPQNCYSQCTAVA
jgi:YD repeat-containing protein